MNSYCVQYLSYFIEFSSDRLIIRRLVDDPMSKAAYGNKFIAEVKLIKMCC